MSKIRIQVRNRQEGERQRTIDLTSQTCYTRSKDLTQLPRPARLARLNLLRQLITTSSLGSYAKFINTGSKLVFQVHVHPKRDDACPCYSTVSLVFSWRQLNVIDGSRSRKRPEKVFAWFVKSSARKAITQVNTSTHREKKMTSSFSSKVEKSVTCFVSQRWSWRIQYSWGSGKPARPGSTC